MPPRRVGRVVAVQSAQAIQDEARRFALQTSQRRASGAVPGAVRKYTRTFGSTSAKNYVIAHGLNTTDVFVQLTALVDTAVNGIVEIVDANSVSVRCDQPPGANAFRILVIG